MTLRILFFGLFFMSCYLQVKSEFKQNNKQSLITKETNPVNFMRLVIMRLVYGIASAMGFEENLSGVLGGIFVPPGANDYEDYGDYIPDLFR